jgi:hypothetical protein
MSLMTTSFVLRLPEATWKTRRIIDVGRRTRVTPAALRRAVIARDRHCTYQGCDRPTRWCDVHHKTHWADGGETCLHNLCLLCRFHHTLIHQEVDDLVGTRPI